MKKATNKKAFYDYEILEKIEAGVVLAGTEVKSIKASNISLKESYVKLIKDELWLVGAYIAQYPYGGKINHEERRDRKLLVSKKEILKLKKSIQEKGFTIVPLSVYLKNGFIKVEIGLAKGKKQYDKRESIKKREESIKLERAIKNI